MFIYFPAIDSFLTCDEYPSFISSKIMTEHNLEYKCNRWMKSDDDYYDDYFALSYS